MRCAFAGSEAQHGHAGATTPARQAGVLDDGLSALPDGIIPPGDAPFRGHRLPCDERTTPSFAKGDRVFSTVAGDKPVDNG